MSHALKLRVDEHGVDVLNTSELFEALGRSSGSAGIPAKDRTVDEIIEKLKLEYETDLVEVLSDARDILGPVEKILITAEQIRGLIPGLEAQDVYDIVTIHPPDGFYDHWYGYIGFKLNGEYRVTKRQWERIKPRLEAITGPEWSSAHDNAKFPFYFWKQDGPRISHRKLVQESLF